MKKLNNKGFTLVELIVVIAVLAIITVVSVPLITEYVEKSRIGTDRNAIGEVGHAAEVAYVKEDMKKEGEVLFEVRINPQGIANYGGDGGSQFVESVAKVLPPESYIYKSKAYRGNTVQITVDTDGVAHINEEFMPNKTVGEALGFDGVVGDWIDNGLAKLEEWTGNDQISEILSDAIFDIESNYGSFKDLPEDKKEEYLNEFGKNYGVDDLGTLAGNAGLLDDEAMDALGKVEDTFEDVKDTVEDFVEDVTSCVATGSELTLADGSVKKVEDLLPTDKLLAFDHETGKYIEADILAVAHHGDKFRHVMNLEFSNGVSVKLVDYHGLFDVTLNKYVYLTNDNFVEYKGHEFAMKSANGYETAVLENAFLSYEFTGAYGVVTDYHMNCFTNGFFSIIPEAKIAVDAFEFDADLKFDTEKMLQDIATYGLFEYEEFASYVSEEVFELLPLKYVKVTAAKGLTTMEEVAEILDSMSSYLSLFGEEATYIKDMR